MRMFVKKGFVVLLLLIVVLQGTVFPAYVNANEGHEQHDLNTEEVDQNLKKAEPEKQEEQVEPQSIAVKNMIDQSGNVDIARMMTLQYALKGNATLYPVESTKAIDTNQLDYFEARFQFSIADTEDAFGQAVRSVSEGDYFIMELPQELAILNPQGAIIESPTAPGSLIASYDFIPATDTKGWQVKFTLGDIVEDKNEFDIEAHMNFTFMIDASKLPEDKDTTISIPLGDGNTTQIKLHKPKPPETTPIKLEKVVDGEYKDETRDLTWKVSLTPNKGVFEGYTFRDTIDTTTMEFEYLEHGGETIRAKDPLDPLSVGYDYDPVTGALSYLIPSGKNGTNDVKYATIKVHVKVKDSLYQTQGSDIKLTNTASLSGTSPEGIVVDLSDTATKNVLPEWMKKEGAIYSGNEIQWTLTVNSTNQNMYNAVVTDTLSSNVALDTIKGISLKTGENTIMIPILSSPPTDDKEIYATLQNQELKIFFERGKDNASNKKRTISFVTNITRVSSGNVTHENKATLETSYLGGDGIAYTITPALGMGSVTVPSAYIAKSANKLSADNKRNGTIDWNIDVASNLSIYGKSEIVDSIPQDQDFVEGSVILAGTSLTKNPTEDVYYTYDDTNRKLSIYFAQDNALQAAQHVTFKTKIKEAEYGQNLSKRKFRNEATVNVYDANVLNQIVATNSSSADVEVTNQILDKKAIVYDGNTSGETQYPRIAYEIAINANKMPLQNATLDDDFNLLITEYKKGDEAYTVVNGATWQLVESSLELVKADGTLVDHSAWTYTYIDNKLHVVFNGGIIEEYKVRYQLELDVNQNAVFKENGKLKIRGNTASLKDDKLKDGELLVPAKDEGKEIDHIVLGKSGSQSMDSIKEQQVLWTIQVNQHGAMLDSNVIEDILPKGLSLDPTSLTLYENVLDEHNNFKQSGKGLENSTQIQDIDFVYDLAKDPAYAERSVLRVTLPERNKAYVLQFSTDIDKSVLGTDIANSASFAGDSGNPIYINHANIKLASNPGGISTRKTSIEIKKQDSDTLAPLEGASFQLFWVNGTKETFVREVTTDATGSAIAYGLSKNETYKIKESVAPSGYAMDDTVGQSILMDDTITSVTFKNTRIKQGTWTPKAYKSLNRELDKEFNFTIQDDTNKVLMTGKNEISTTDKKTNVKFNLVNNVEAKNLLTFENTYTFGTHETEHEVLRKTLTIAEEKPSLPGYEVYDKTKHTYTIIVTNVKGEKDLKVTILNDKGIDVSDGKGNFKDTFIPEFRNLYTLEGTFIISAEKELQGRRLEDQQFQFTATPCDVNGVVLANEPVLEARNDENGRILFDAIAFSKSQVGMTFYYLVEEVDNAQSGYGYDASKYQLSISVLDRGNGTYGFDSKVTKDKAIVPQITFMNSYTTSDTSYTIRGSKVAKNILLKDKQFTFLLLDDSGNVLDKTTNDVNGNFKFKEFTYSQQEIGNHTYKVIEEAGVVPGIVYDTRSFDVHVEVVDQGDGTLTTKTSILQEGIEQANIIFQNEYQAKTMIQLQAQKVLEGAPLENQQFTFELLDDQNDVMETVHNKADGSILFSPIAYELLDVGEHIYYIQEVQGTNPTILYDQTRHEIHVNVKDLGNGVLSATITNADDSNKQITFINKYQEPQTPKDKDLPNTGDNSNIFIYFVCMSLALLSCGFLLHKRRK